MDTAHCFDGRDFYEMEPLADDRVKCGFCGHLDTEYEVGSGVCFTCSIMEEEEMGRLAEEEPRNPLPLTFDEMAEAGWADGPYGRIE